MTGEVSVALWMHVIQARRGVVTVRDVAALHAALLVRAATLREVISSGA